MSFIKRSHKKNSFIRVPILEYFTSKLEMNPCVVLAILSSLLALQASADDICNGKDNGYYADPNNCIKYYHCFNGVTEEHITCPEGTRSCNLLLLMAIFILIRQKQNLRN